MTDSTLAAYILNTTYRNNDTVRHVHKVVIGEPGGATVRDTIAKVKPGGGLSRGLVLLFAAACGLSVANLYYAQPLLDTIARTFVTNSGTAGLVVTLAQIGFAVGLALLVPLGDLLSRRRLVPVVLIISAGALVASALAPDIGVLIAVALIVGAGSVMAQVLVPMAASLASEDRRGQVVGTVMSGLLLGILLARTVSGVVADVSSWRVVYAMAAVLMVVLAVVLARLLPEEGERPRIGYGSLLRSTARLMFTEPILRRRAWFGALGFASFSVFWTTMAFLLSGAPYHYGDLAIGLFGLVGAGGALCATFAGRWADRRSTKASTLAFTICIGSSFLPLWYGRHDLVMLIVGILVLDIGVQGLQITNQSMIYQLGHSVRSRLTAAYMVCYFAGGALGSAIGASLYDSHHWAGVCALGAGLGIVATASALIDAARRPGGTRTGPRSAHASGTAGLRTPELTARRRPIVRG
jgi:predicted MFS family arabinose efflux permease